MANQAVRAFRDRECHSTQSVPTLLRGSREKFRKSSPLAKLKSVGQCLLLMS